LRAPVFPILGETVLLIAAIAAGTTHQLAIAWVIVAAASGAILGDNLGFWIGREGGYRLLRRSGRFVRLNVRKPKLGLYLFRHPMAAKWSSDGTLCHRPARLGGLVFPGPIRWAGLVFCSSMRVAGIVWASLVGLGGYVLGDNVHRLSGPVGIGGAVLAGLLSIAFFVFLHRSQHRLEDEAERALPGSPL
jgi:membrane protein DedA with SNARE-associated domain